MAENVFESNVVVLNKLGLHARPAALLAKKAMEFDCDIVAERWRIIRAAQLDEHFNASSTTRSIFYNQNPRQQCRYRSNRDSGIV